MENNCPFKCKFHSAHLKFLTLLQIYVATMRFPTTLFCCNKILLYFCCMFKIMYNKPCPMRKMTLVRNTCFYVCSMNTKQKYLVVKGYEIGHSICQGIQWN